MRTSRRAVFLAPLLFLPSIPACSDMGRAAAGVTVRDSSGVEIITSSLPTVHGELVEQLRIGVQEGDENLQFFTIGSVGVDGSGQIYVADGGSSTIRVFDGDGSLVRTIGGRGEGPGEFQQLVYAWVGASEILTMGRSGGPPGLSRFAKSGEYLGTQPYRLPDGTTMNPLGSAGDSWIMMVRQRPARSSMVPGTAHSDSFEIARVSLDGVRSDPFLSFPMPATIVATGGSMMMAGPLFDPTPHAAIDASGQIYGTVGDRYIIDVFDAEGRLSKRISRQHEPRPVQQEWVEAFEDAVREYNRGLPDFPGKDQEIRRVIDGVVGLMRATHLPPTDRLLVAGDGAFWVERSDLDEEPWLRGYRTVYGTRGQSLPPSVWDVFDASGRYTVTATLPEKFSPFQVTATSVIGVLRDELDVEYVVRYRVALPAS